MLRLLTLILRYDATIRRCRRRRLFCCLIDATPLAYGERLTPYADDAIRHIRYAYV